MLFCFLLFWGGPTKPFSGDDDIPSLCLSSAYYSCIRVFADSPPSSSSSALLHLLHHPSSPPCGASASATQPLRLMRHRLRITFQPHMSTPLLHLSSTLSSTPTHPSTPPPHPHFLSSKLTGPGLGSTHMIGMYRSIKVQDPNANIWRFMIQESVCLMISLLVKILWQSWEWVNGWLCVCLCMCVCVRACTHVCVLF